MPKIQCHIGKVKLSGLGGMRNHLTNRERSRSNPDIDHARTQDNYFLLDGENLVRIVNTKIKMEVARKPRPDAVGMVDVVCGASREYMQSLSQEQQREFFQSCLSFLSARYGAGNVVYGAVHMDETNPHIHVGVVPIRDGCLSAKKIFNRLELSNLQTSIAETVGKVWGLERGEVGSGGRRYKELQEFKRKGRFHQDKPNEKAQEGFEKARRSSKYASKMGGLIEDRENVIMPVAEWKRMARLARRAATVEADYTMERAGRIAEEKAYREAERERQRLAIEVEQMRREEPDKSIPPPRYLPMIEELIEKERQRIRDAGDDMNRSICKTFLQTGEDFRKTVEIAAPVLDSFGIPTKQHGVYVRECLRAVSLQAAKKKRGGRRGQKWTPQPKETDYRQETSSPVGNLGEWREADFIGWVNTDLLRGRNCLVR